MVMCCVHIISYTFIIMLEFGEFRRSHELVNIIYISKADSAIRSENIPKVDYIFFEAI